MHCQLSNTPFPSPKFYMTAMRIGEDTSKELLNRKRANLFLNKTLLKTLFDNDTVVVNVSCRVSNSFGSDELTTLISACGKYYCSTFQRALFY